MSLGGFEAQERQGNRMHVSPRAVRVQLVDAFLVFNEEVATVEKPLTV